MKITYNDLMNECSIKHEFDADAVRARAYAAAATDAARDAFADAYVAAVRADAYNNIKG